MRVQAKLESIKQTKPKDIALRFALGGLVTGVAGLIAHRYGPVVGGLFLAFPAILPASLTLVSKHEKDKEAQAGENDDHRACDAAAIDAAGAAIGSIGLAAFGVVVWLAAIHVNALPLLVLAALAWTAVSVAGWVIRQRI